MIAGFASVGEGDGPEAADGAECRLAGTRSPATAATHRGTAVRERGDAFDTGWVGAGEEDDLDRRLAAEEEPFDLKQPHVMTTLGPIAPAALGPTLAAERVSPVSAGPGDDPPDDPRATLAELEDFFAAGGRAVLDATTADRGRDVVALRWIAARAPVHLIAVTGVADPPDPGREPTTHTEHLAAAFAGELTEGIAGTPTRAGAIMVGTRDDLIAEGVALRAAALAHGSTGAPILLRPDRPGSVPAALAMLRREGVEARRVVVRGFAGRPEGHELEAILATGAFLAIDRLAANGAWPAVEQAASIRALVAAGQGDRLLLSPGLRRRSSLRAYGGEPGWVWLLERFALTLMETGLDATTVRRLLVDNPARALTIGRGGETGEG